MLGKLFFRSKRKRRKIEDQVLLQLGPKDAITIRDGFANVMAYGGVGAGKTSGTAYHASYNMLLHGLGGCVLTAKKSEVERWQRLCELTGRSDDLIIIGDDSPHRFSVLDYVLDLYGRNSVGIENIVAMLDAAAKIAEQVSGRKESKGTEGFFETGIHRRTNAIVGLAVYALGRARIEELLEIMREVPQRAEMVNSQSWRDQSLIVRLVGLARDRNREDASALYDIDQIESYFLDEAPKIADKTRSVFEAGVFNLLDPLSRGKLYWTFGRDTTVSPQHCNDARILLVNMPMATHGTTGAVAQALVKICFQKMIQQRSAASELPLFLAIDEYQTLVTDSDYQHMAISRESRVVNLFLTQSIASLYAAGGDTSAIDSLCGLATYKVFHANSDTVSNTWASEVIGKRLLRQRSSSVNHPPFRLFGFFEEDAGFSTSLSESFEYPVPPHVFTSLMRGGPPRMETEAIVFGGGRIWNATGDTYMKATFKQGF